MGLGIRIGIGLGIGLGMGTGLLLGLGSRRLDEFQWFCHIGARYQKWAQWRG